MRPLAIALAGVAAVIALQLIPLPFAALTRVSPATDRFVRQMDLSYELARTTGGAVWHPVSIAPSETLKGMGFFAALSLFLLGTTAMIPKVPVRALIRGFVALGLLVSLFGIVQRATFNDRLYWIFEPMYTADNAFGPFVNRNHFAGWMVMVSGVTGGYVCSLVVSLTQRGQSWRNRVTLISTRDGRRLVFATCALAVIAFSIVWTMSRSGIVALAMCTALMTTHAVARFRGPRRWLSIVLLVGVVGSAIAYTGPTIVLASFGRTSTLVWRLQLWRDTLAIIEDFPWLGTGLNTYGAATLIYPTTDRSTHAVQAHNDYLQIVSEGGLLLAIATAAAIWQVVRAIRAALAERQNASLYWVRFGATMGLIGIAVQELVDFSLQIPANAVLFVVLIAIAIHRTPTQQPPVRSLTRTSLRYAEPNLPSLCN